MDKKKEGFLARLRETFRVEASEHLEAITAGLLAIERASDAECASIVEFVFREAHSLKGAARSVNLAGVEALCLELESIFAAMKREELTLSMEMLDAIHPALGVLATLCGSPGAPPSPEGKEREEQALGALKRIVRERWISGPKRRRSLLRLSHASSAHKRLRLRLCRQRRQIHPHRRPLQPRPRRILSASPHRSSAPSCSKPRSW